jgi:hypothetical protein
LRQLVETAAQQLASLDDAVGHLEGILRSLRAVREIELTTAKRELRRAAEIASNVRQGMAAADAALGRRSGDWPDRAALDARLAELREVVSRNRIVRARAQLRSIELALRAGGIHHRSPAKCASLARLRDAAASQAGDLAASTAPPTLPGPDDGAGWLRWVWSLSGPQFDVEEQTVRAGAPAIADFVRDVEPEWFRIVTPPQAGEGATASGASEQNPTDLPTDPEVEAKPTVAGAEPPPSAPSAAANPTGVAEAGVQSATAADGASATVQDDAETDEVANSLPASQPVRDVGRAADAPTGSRSDGASGRRPRPGGSNPTGLVLVSRHPPTEPAPTTAEAAAEQLRDRRPLVTSADVTTDAKDAPESAAAAPTSSRDSNSQPTVQPGRGAAPQASQSAEAEPRTPRIEPGNSACAGAAGPKPAVVKDERAAATNTANFGAADESPVMAPVVASMSIPREIADWTSFRAAHVIDSKGRCVREPWKAPEFLGRASSAEAAALADGDLARMWCFSSAIVQLGGRPLVRPEVIEAFAEMLAKPESGGARVASWWSSAWGAAAIDQTDTERKLRLVLAALHPDVDDSPVTEDVVAAVSAAKFGSAEIRDALHALFRVHRFGGNPIEWIRSVQGKGGVDAGPVRDPEKEIAKARADVRAWMLSNSMAAGGRLIASHCKDAWRDFVAESKDLLQRFFPEQRGGAPAATLAALQQQVIGLRTRHTAIADEVGARFNDRHRMDNAVEDVVSRCLRVIDLVNRASGSRRRRTAEHAAIPGDAVLRLEEIDSVRDPSDRLAQRGLLAPRAPGGSAKSPLLLGVRDIRERPWLLLPLGRWSAEEWKDDDEAGIDVRRSASVLQLATCLLMDAAPIGDEPPDRWLDSTRSILVELRLDDLLATNDENVRGAGPVAGGRAGEHLTQLETALDRLRSALFVMDALADPVVPFVRRTLEYAESDDAPPREGTVRLLCEWLDRVSSFSEERAAAGRGSLEAEADVLPEDRRAEVRRLIATGNFLDALAAVRVERAEDASVRLGEMRAIPWRDSVRLPDLRARTATQQELVARWKKGLAGSPTGTDATLRREFVNLVFAGIAEDGRRRARGTGPDASPEPAIEFTRRDVRVRCSAVVDEIRSGTTAQFLPQFCDLGDLLVLTPEIVWRGADRIASQVAATAAQHDGLTVVLFPGLPAESRAATVAMIRQRKIRAAIIDDVDVARLLSCPTPLLGFAEVVLEQLAWSESNPFRISEGQHVRKEMFVGRRTEALRLFSDATYSRVFSGRKLGKSALLRFVEQEYDGKRLPSGNTLRVVYISAPGAGNDEDVVDRIRRAVDATCDFHCDVPAAGRPADELVGYFRRFLADRPRESLLVVIDEADRFVEQQLEAYDRDPHNLLSDRMRSEISGDVDQVGTPRVRFVLSGYRSTNTREGGHWRNWGDPLILNPLEPDEAAQLIAGPLARIGIDAAALAPGIAWRCGYQPAILLRFGSELVRHLTKSRGSTRASPVVVRPADVAAVANSSEFQSEVRTVVFNNFDGHKVSELVFDALLIELAGAPLLGGIDDAPDRIRERLRATCGELSWLGGDRTAQCASVELRLKELRDRQLVRKYRDSRKRDLWALRFPHQLSLLLEGDIESQMRDIAAELRGTSSSGMEFRSLLGPHDETALRAVVHQDRTESEAPGGVVASLWPAAVARRPGGIAEALHFRPDDVCRSGAPTARELERPSLVVCNVSAEEAARIWKERSHSLPPPLLVGGIDLLRAVRAADLLYEIRTLQRLDPARVEWWFNRIHAFEFARPSAIMDVMRVTSGVPLLLGHFEQCLSDAGCVDGQSVSPRQFEIAEARFSATFAEFVRSTLGNGTPSARLTRRESEIVRMVAEMSRETGPNAAGFSDYLGPLTWESDERRGVQPLDPTSIDDVRAVQVVLDLGLVPADPEGSGSFGRLRAAEASDAIHRIAACLGPADDAAAR